MKDIDINELKQLTKDVSVLYVEDDAETRSFVEGILKQIFDNVYVAANGELGVKSFELHKQELIITDINMPGMSGIEMLKAISHKNRGCQYKTIVITAYSEQELFLETIDIGVDGFILKPIKTDNILKTIYKVAKHINLVIEKDNLKRQIEDQNIKLESQMLDVIKKYNEQQNILFEQSKNALMGEMISAIAHQWKQPLNALAIIVQDIKEAYEYDELNIEYLEDFEEKALNQIEFMSKTISDFRDFLKPNKRKENFLIKDALENINHILQAQLKVHSIKLKIDVDDISLNGIKGEFEQIALNLINNSKDAIISKQKDGFFEGEITVSATQDDSKTIVEFKDNGGGIPDSMIDKIFSPYFTSKGKNGTGIGLYIVKMLSESSFNGDISVYNENGGAVFKITIPK